MLSPGKACWLTGSLLILTLAFLAPSGWAQPNLFYGPLSDHSQFGIRFLHPHLSDDFDLKVLTGTYDFSFAFPVGTAWSLVGTVPFVKVAIERQDSSNFGNIYVGLQTREPEERSRSTRFGFGAFLPTATRDDESTLLFGALTNYHDVAKYLPEYLTLVMTPNYRQRVGTSGVLGLEVGPQVLIPTGGEGDELEIFLQYGIAAGLQASSLSLLAEFMGLFMMTIDDLDLGERFVNSVQARASTRIGLFRPSVFYRLPLDDNQQEFLDASLGVQLEVTLK